MYVALLVVGSPASHACADWPRSRAGRPPWESRKARYAGTLPVGVLDHLDRGSRAGRAQQPSAAGGPVEEEVGVQAAAADRGAGNPGQHALAGARHPTCPATSAHTDSPAMRNPHALRST